MSQDAITCFDGEDREPNQGPVLYNIRNIVQYLCISKLLLQNY